MNFLLEIMFCLGGEIPALVFVDAVSRMLDNILGDINSAYTDSFFIGGFGLSLLYKTKRIFRTRSSRSFIEWKS